MHAECETGPGPRKNVDRGCRRRTELVLLAEHVRFMDENFEVHARVCLVRGHDEIDEPLDWLLVQILPQTPGELSIIPLGEPSGPGRAAGCKQTTAASAQRAGGGAMCARVERAPAVGGGEGRVWRGDVRRGRQYTPARK